jgi:hypothetical protein
MMNTYTTYYMSSSGQPANNTQTHASFGAALEAWECNCAALSRRSGGKSVLREDGSDSSLVWFEHCEGAYLSGEMSVQDASEDADVSTPAAVVAAYRGSR